MFPSSLKDFFPFAAVSLKALHVAAIKYAAALCNTGQGKEKLILILLIMSRSITVPTWYIYAVISCFSHN